MTNIKSTKRALLCSTISLFLCFTMLLGTTYAWFTDSVVSANNIISSGNLGVVVKYTLDGENWGDFDGATDVFQKGLWEPGHTEVVALEIKNNGSLALKYNVNMNIVQEIIGKTHGGADIVLSDILTVASKTTDAESDIKAAFSAEDGITYDVTTGFVQSVLGKESGQLLETGDTDYVIVKVDMAETVGNEASHNGTDIPSIEFGINVLAAQHTYESDSFDNQYDASAEYFDGKLRGGVFEKNPVEIDPSLAEADSEYIAVNYEKDGKTYYTVSKRAETVVLAASDTVYTPVNNNYPVIKNASGKLYEIISGLQGNEHSTVYILPGTYNEATAINVYSSMDIIGLGNAEDIKIIKVKGSYSNRHLFNCNGAVTRNEHIQVTIRNLYLDATAKNLNSAGKLYITDNAAVQSIRLSKVKCYNLIIKKGNGFPFYVNGKYDVRGAYMYVENCTTDTSSVVDKASVYKFYHNNITTKNGVYTENSGDELNRTMDENVWLW